VPPAGWDSSMTDPKFWNIVSLLDWSNWDNDERAVLEPAIRTLAELPVPEILMFEEFLRWRVYSLDTREHARHAGSGEEYDTYTDPDKPFSTDGFLYCRGMVVAKGCEEYEAVLADPHGWHVSGLSCFCTSPGMRTKGRRARTASTSRASVSRQAATLPVGCPISAGPNSPTQTSSPPAWPPAERASAGPKSSSAG
jgi:uncharacterized protein DUF4240